MIRFLETVMMLFTLSVLAGIAGGLSAHILSILKGPERARYLGYRRPAVPRVGRGCTGGRRTAHLRSL